MARKIYYEIREESSNVLEEEQWEEISRLQNWYNGEFLWTAGKLSFRRYVVFPNTYHSGLTDTDFMKVIRENVASMRKSGHSEREIIDGLAKMDLVIVKQGGYQDGCIASGFTRVAGNEYNAYLVCEFLLHASRIAPGLQIDVNDEGEFIKPKKVTFSNGSVFLKPGADQTLRTLESLIREEHVFSIVDDNKYNNFPQYKTIVPDFYKMDPGERRAVLQDWSWFGYRSTYDQDGDDLTGLNLNSKVRKFGILG